MKKNSLTTNHPFLRQMLLAFYFFFIFSAGLGTAGYAQGGKPGVFYAITGPSLQDTSYLFGTYHLIRSSFLDGKDQVRRAFNRAGNIVVEVVVDSSELKQANARALLKGKYLRDLLDAPFADSLDHILRADMGVGLEQFNTAKPVAVTLTLSMVYMLRNSQGLLNKFTGLPLDNYFVTTGKEKGKSVVALETITQQMNFLFDKVSDEAQVNNLKMFIRHRSENIQLGDDLLKQYLGNDLDGMQRTYEAAMALSGEEDQLVSSRNARWMEKLPSLLSRESNFIAVGSLHLAGPQGLVAQLRRMGYTVTPLNL